MVTVYVESNFLLEVTYEQEEADACEELLSLAEAGRVELAIPAFALLEPVWSVPHRSDVRNEKRQALQSVFKDLQRSASFFADGLRIESEIKTLFDRCEKAEADRLDRVRERLLARANVLAMSARTLQEARTLMLPFDLEEFDAVMLASVMLDRSTRTNDGCFLNRNKKDFETQDIKAALKARGCKFLRSFRDGLAWVRARVEA